MLGEPPTAAVKTILSFLGMYEDLLLECGMWEDNGHLQSPATTQLVGLQSLVYFWKESPPAGVQGVAKGIRSRLEQAADFQYVR